MSDLLSVVIPTFNEGGNIENLVSQIDEALEGINYEIIFVDDSKDNTPDIIKEVSKMYVFQVDLSLVVMTADLMHTESSYQEQQEKWGRLSSHALENLQTQQVDYLCSAGA